MAHRVWILINLLVIAGTAAYIWLFHPHPFAVIRSGQFTAQAAIILFIINLVAYPNRDRRDGSYCSPRRDHAASTW